MEITEKTIYCVDDKEFSTLEEAQAYQFSCSPAIKEFELYDDKGNLLSLDDAIEDEMIEIDYIHIKTEEGAKLLQKLFQEYFCLPTPEKVGWYRYNYDDDTWLEYNEEVKIVKRRWKPVASLMEETKS